MFQVPDSNPIIHIEIEISALQNCFLKLVEIKSLWYGLGRKKFLNFQAQKVVSGVFDIAEHEYDHHFLSDHPTGSYKNIPFESSLELFSSCLTRDLLRCRLLYNFCLLLSFPFSPKSQKSLSIRGKDREKQLS